MSFEAPTAPFLAPHPHLSDSINRRLIESEVMGGVHLWDVPPGTVLEVVTSNRCYTIVHQGWGEALICGHPEFCPEPVLVHINGSTWGGTMIKHAYIGRGMHLEFRQGDRLPVTTSRILEVRERR